MIMVQQAPKRRKSIVFLIWQINPREMLNILKIQKNAEKCMKLSKFYEISRQFAKINPLQWERYNLIQFQRF